MDDRKLKEYALNIYNNIAGYSLQKAFTLFPKYYPKIAFYYSELITKKQEELATRAIQSLGIDKARALINELDNLSIRALKFYVNAKFKFDESYRRLDAATDEYDSKIIGQEVMTTWVQIAKQTIDYTKKGDALLFKIRDEAQIYNFVSLENDITNAIKSCDKIITELYELDKKFLKYMEQQYQYKELW